MSMRPRLDHKSVISKAQKSISYSNNNVIFYSVSYAFDLNFSDSTATRPIDFISIVFFCDYRKVPKVARWLLSDLATLGDLGNCYFRGVATFEFSLLSCTVFYPF